MTLGELIELLESHEGKQLNFIISDPHSSRGWYTKLAFVVSSGSMPVTEALSVVKSALDQEYEGYKGGQYIMNEWSDVVLVTYKYESGDASGNLLFRLAITRLLVDVK